LGSVEGGQQNVISIDNNGISNNTITTNNLAQYDQFYANVMNTSGRISSGSTVINAGKTNEISNNGSNSFQITFRPGDDVECEIECPTILRLLNSGVVEYKNPPSSGEWRVLRSETCCSEKGYYSYYDNTFPFIPESGLSEQEGGPIKCYWCPPKEYILGQTTTVEDKEGNLSTQTQFFFTPPGSDFIGGQIQPISNKNCCVLRGYKWDNNKKICTTRDIGDAADPIIGVSGGGLVTG